MERKIVVFITDFDLEFHHGASWQRMKIYAHGLTERGCKCFLFSTLYDYSTTVIEKDIDDFVVLEGVRKGGKLTFKDVKFSADKKFCNSVFGTITKRGYPKKDLRLLVYNPTLSLSLNTLFYFKYKLRIPLFLEKNELYVALVLNFATKATIQDKLMFPLIKTLRLVFAGITDCLAFFFTGIIVISSRLENLYGFKKNIIRLPILTEPEKLHLKSKNHCEQSSFKIGFFGTISEKKDGIVSLIEALDEVNINKKVQLDLFGPVTRGVSISQLVDNDYIHYNGNIDPVEVRERLKEYDLLALVRPSSLQANFGFSTKLAEYLSSSVPVLVTNVSDVGLYLENNKNAFIIPSDKQNLKENIVLKLKQVLEMSREQRKIIADAGCLVSRSSFGINKYAEDLYQFFE